MTYVYTVGVDPGVSCGLAALRNGHREFTWQGSHDEVTRVLVPWLNHVVATNAVVTFGCERYTKSTRAARSEVTAPEEVIGIVRDVARRYRCTFVLQQPATAKRMIPNVMLLRLGLYTRPGDVGAPDAHDVNDAMRHSLLVLATHHASIFDQITRLGDVVFDG